MVRVVNSEGAEFGDSGETNVTPVPQILVAPTNLSATTADAQVLLSWDAVFGAAEYRVYRATDTGDLTRIADSNTITETTFTDTGLTNDTTYRYAVSAVNAAGESPRSAEVTATPELAIPPAPENFSVTVSVVAGDVQASLSWDAIFGTDTYQVYRADSLTAALVRIADNTTITDAAYTNIGLTGGTAYRYTVRAVNAAGEGADSNEVSITAPTPLAGPANLSAAAAVIAGNSQVSLSWDAVPGAAEYQVYRADTANGALTRIAEGTTITDTTYTDTGLTGGTAYRYTVRAANADGDSADSSEASITAPTPLAAPANFSAVATVAAGDPQASLSWDAVPGAAEYQVYRADTANGTLTRIADSTTITDTAYTDTGLTDGTVYRYTVRAVNSDGDSADSSEAGITAPTPLAAPANLSASTALVTGDSQVSLSWDAVPGAAEYRVYRADTASGEFTRIADSTTISETTYTDTGLTEGTAYRYTVRAVDSIGEGPDSSAASVTALVSPAAPANLSATAAVVTGDSQVSLSWDAVMGATEYRVYRSLEGTFILYNRIADDTTITTTSYTNTGLTGGTSYRYLVRAVDGNGESANSNIVRITALSAPSVPANLRAVAGDNRITLSWDSVSGATEYRIYRSATTGGTLTRIASGTTITATTYINTGLTNGTTYRYTIRAANNIGESTDSSEVTATPVAPTVVPTAPGNLRADNGSLAVRLTWDSVSGVNEYRIYRSATTGGTLTRIASSTTITAATYTDTGLTSLTTYRYVVRAVNRIGESANSNEVSTTPDDHGNSRDLGTPVTSGTAVAGRIDTAGERDYFTITVTLTPGQTATIHATTTGSTDTFGIIWSGGAALVTDNDSGTGSNFSATTTTSTSGTYQIDVRGLPTVTGDYSLTVTVTIVTVADDHGNSADDATAVTSGTAVAGEIEIPGDHDYFSIAVTGASSTSPVTITASTMGGVGSRLTGFEGVLYNSSGTAIASDTIGQDGINFNASVTEDGTYYVRMRGFSDTNTGSYTLTITTSQ